MREHLEIIESTQAKCLFGKISMKRQSAGNQISYRRNDKVGSSETIRGTLNCNDLHNLNFGITFRDWLIGFTEGDGSFIINKSGYLEFKITRPTSDAQVLFYIKKNLGFGSVSIQDKKIKTHHYRVRDRKGLRTLICIFNGRLCTSTKTHQFNRWVKAFNLVYDTELQVYCSENTPSFENAWLAGFTDAEGCFTCSIISRSLTYSKIQVKYILSQKDEYKLLTKIAALTGGKVHHSKFDNGYTMTVNLSNLSRTIRYFNIYGLKTKKYISYLNWIKVYKLVKAQKHLNTEGLIKIRNLINKINAK